MAKFCSKCGNELPGNVKFCSKCGAPVQGAAGGAQGGSSMQGSGTYGGSGVQGSGSAHGDSGIQGSGAVQGFGNYGAAASVQKKSAKPVIAIGAAAAALIVVFILVKIFGGGSYKTPIEKLEKGLNKQDAKLISEAFVNGAGFADSDVADLFSGFGGLLDYEIKLEILDKHKLEKNAIVQVLTDEYYVDMVYAGQAKAAYILNVKMTMRMGGYTEDDTEEIPVAKIGGKWVIPMDISDF